MFTFKGKPVKNMDRVIRFMLDGDEMVKRMVLTVNDRVHEISVASPVGSRLANAEPDNEFVIPIAGPVTIRVKVLSIAAPVAA